VRASGATMRERLALRVDLIAEVERRAKDAGEPFELTFARILSRGLLRVVAEALAPLLAEPAGGHPLREPAGQPALPRGGPPT
jgi:hypothetical protein